MARHQASQLAGPCARTSWRGKEGCACGGRRVCSCCPARVHASGSSASSALAPITSQASWLGPTGRRRSAAHRCHLGGTGMWCLSLRESRRAFLPVPVLRAATFEMCWRPEDGNLLFPSGMFFKALPPTKSLSGQRLHLRTRVPFSHRPKDSTLDSIPPFFVLYLLLY